MSAEDKRDEDVEMAEVGGLGGKKPPEQPNQAAPIQQAQPLVAEGKTVSRFSTTVVLQVELADSATVGKCFRPNFRQNSEKQGRWLSLTNNRAESEFFVGFLCGRVFGLPTQVALQKTFSPAFLADSAWLPPNAGLDNKMVFFCFRVEFHSDAEKIAQHINDRPLVRSVQFSDVARKPTKMIAVQVVGLPLHLEQEQADAFVDSLNLPADTMSFRVYTSIGRRGTARVFLPVSLLPLLHAMPFKTTGTKYFKAEKNKASWQWCSKCWTHKANGSGNCQDCQVRCSRCGGDHLLRVCGQQRGSCKHCKHIGKSDEECATHIISTCRLLRENLKPVLLPAPSKELLVKYPHLKDSLPRKLLVRDAEPVVKQILVKAPRNARSYAEAAAVDNRAGDSGDNADLRKQLSELAEICKAQAKTITSLTAQVAQLQETVRQLASDRQQPILPLPIQPMPSFADLQATFNNLPSHQLLDADFPPLGAEQLQRPPHQPIREFGEDAVEDDDVIEISQKLDEAEAKEALSTRGKRQIDDINNRDLTRVTPDAKRHMAAGAGGSVRGGRGRKKAVGSSSSSSSTASGAIAPNRR
jgi:hypothetical protein